MTHDYKRNGTTTLFAALDTATGEVYGLCQERHRHQEWLKFLRQIDQTVPADKEIHIICDNYATHKHPNGCSAGWHKHKRFHVHFTPTSASWLNMIERFFRDLTESRIRRGVFQDLEQLIMAIGDYIDRHNENPKPFIWTAKANDILEKVTRAKTMNNENYVSSIFLIHVEASSHATGHDAPSMPCTPVGLIHRRREHVNRDQRNWMMASRSRGF